MTTYLTGSDDCCSYRFKLGNGEYSLGRKADNDFVIFNPTISRVHAEIIVDDGSVFINDLKSHNGTFINDVRVSAKSKISLDDNIRIGVVDFKLTESVRSTKETLTDFGLKSEAQFAAHVQKKLINFTVTPPTGFEMASYLEQCSEIGGDFFDVMHLEEGGSVVLVADVSGHGMGAALLMSHLLASFRTLCLSGKFDLVKCVNILSKLLFNHSDSTQFATLFIAYISDNNDLKYINAGHCPPMIIKNDTTITRLDSTGTVIGVFNDNEWSMNTEKIESDDTLLIFTDGLTEAVCNDNQYGEERLIKVLNSGRDLSLNSLIEHILLDVDLFICEEPRTDDLTLFALRRK